jgi:hemoglobin-like flavoprotein
MSIDGEHKTSSTDDEHSTPTWTRFLLTDNQKNIIYTTWRHLSDDMVNTGVTLFLRIFKHSPEVKNLFNFQDLEMSQLPDNPHFRGHATHFMQVINELVDNLDDLDTNLTPLLLALGEQHSQTQRFGIQYFEVFAQCLIIVWEERLGDEFTPEVRAAWEKLFVFMLMTLREGYIHACSYDDKQQSITDDSEHVYTDDDTYV